MVVSLPARFGSHGHGAGLQQLVLDGPAARAAVDRHQSSLLDVEHLALIDLPFVKAAATQGFTLMFLGGLGAAERENVGHRSDARCNAAKG